MGIQEILSARRVEILALAKSHGATDVRVFGSVARGDADEKSDVDFLVNMERGRSLFDLGALLADLEKALHRPVDVVTERGLRSPIRDRVMREAVPI
jgi:predicted nucleotidyltransferase